MVEYGTILSVDVVDRKCEVSLSCMTELLLRSRCYVTEFGCQIGSRYDKKVAFV